MAEIFNFERERAKRAAMETKERAPELDIARFESMRRIVEATKETQPDLWKSNLVARGREFASGLNHEQMVNYVNAGEEATWTANPALYNAIANRLMEEAAEHPNGT